MMSTEAKVTVGGRISGEVLLVQNAEGAKRNANLSGKRTDYDDYIFVVYLVFLSIALAVFFFYIFLEGKYNVFRKC